MASMGARDVGVTQDRGQCLMAATVGAVAVRTPRDLLDQHRHHEVEGARGSIIRTGRSRLMGNLLALAIRAFPAAPGTAVGELASWGLMILGAGLSGAVLRRRRGLTFG
jgi:hypothetical protein